MSEPDDYWLQYFSRPYEDLQSRNRDELEAAQGRRQSLLTERDSLGDNTWADSGRSFGASLLPFLAGAIGGDVTQGLEWGAKSGMLSAAEMDKEDEIRRTELNSEISLADKDIDKADAFSDAMGMNKYKTESELGMNYLTGKFPGTDPYDKAQEDELSKAAAIAGVRADAKRTPPVTEAEAASINSQYPELNVQAGQSFESIDRAMKLRGMGQKDKQNELLQTGEARRQIDQDVKLAGGAPKDVASDVSSMVGRSISNEKNVIPFMNRIKSYQDSLPGGTIPNVVTDAVLSNIPGTEAYDFAQWSEKVGMEQAVATLGAAGLSNNDARIFLDFLGGRSKAIPGVLLERVSAGVDRLRSDTMGQLRSSMAPGRPTKLAATGLASQWLGSLPEDARDRYYDSLFAPTVAVPGIADATKPSTPGTQSGAPQPGQMYNGQRIKSAQRIN